MNIIITGNKKIILEMNDQMMKVIYVFLLWDGININEVVISPV